MKPHPYFLQFGLKGTQADDDSDEFKIEYYYSEESSEPIEDAVDDEDNKYDEAEFIDLIDEEEEDHPE